MSKTARTTSLSVRSTPRLRPLHGACLGVLLLSGAAACVGSSAQVDFPAQVSEESLGFSLEPSRPEEQFKLARRFSSGEGVKANDFWAEYWAWRASRQGYEPALSWLRQQARLEKRDQPALVVFRPHRGIKRERPSAQLWLAMAQPGGEQTAEDRERANALVEEAMPEVQEKALRGDVWGKYLIALIHDVALTDPDSAQPWYAEAAELGHVLSQDALGRMYDEGRGVAQDSVAAHRWFRAAADQGYAPSATMLGWLHDHGRGVAQDPKEAVHWFTAAARQGDAVAQANLGIMFDKGRGTPADPAEAARWYLKAAEQGVAIAENNLGLLYDKGRGVAQNEAEAARWFQLAVSHGYAQAQNNLAVISARRSLAQGDPSVAVALVVRAAVQGDVAAQYDLGTRYDRGQDVRQDPAEAARWYLKASDQGHTHAQNNLGVLCHQGRGVVKNDAQAARLFGLAAAKGDADAQYNLGTMHESGLGVPKDVRVALEWYKRAAAGGSEAAKAAAAQLECELSASTEVFGTLLLCTDRETLRAATRRAGLSIVEESASSSSDVYEGDTVLGVKHVVRVEYTSAGKVAAVLHELPAQVDAAALKRIQNDLKAWYGEPRVEPKDAEGITRQKWTLRDGLGLEYVRGPGNKGSLTFRRP